MLTKSERAEIAESLKKYGEGGTVLYDCLLGVCVPRDTSPDEDRIAIATRLIDLCDTSNMMELPVDKDGEVIRLDDTVYTEDGKEHIVIEFEVYKGRTDVVVSAGTNPYSVTEYAHNLTHKKPVTIESLAGRIRNVVEDERGYISTSAYVTLSRIAEQLERLGDSDD